MDLFDMNWRKSSHSGTQSGCVELAWGQDRMAVRDSKNPAGPILLLPVPAVTALLAGVRSGRLTR